MSHDEQEKALYTGKLSCVTHDIFIDNHFDNRQLCRPPTVYKGGTRPDTDSPNKAAANVSESERSAAETTDTHITVKSEKESRNSSCDHRTLLGGSGKAATHGGGRKKRGLKGMSDFLDAMGCILDGAIDKMGEQCAAQAKADSDECDKDCKLFMDTVKLMLGKE
eukprot:1082489-Rhodomonas_salina.1